MTQEDNQRQNSFIDADYEEVGSSLAIGGKKKPGIAEEDFADFIGKKAQTYFRKFRKFSINEPDKFAVSWNWAAFFFTYIWLAYRKMYLGAGVAFMIGAAIGIMLPVLLPFWWMFFGIAGNFLYFRHARKHILELKATHAFSNRDELSAALQLKGGVNTWILAIAIPLLFIEFILSVFRAL
jgi:hypothetical protein